MKAIDLLTNIAAIFFVALGVFSLVDTNAAHFVHEWFGSPMYIIFSGVAVLAVDLVTVSANRL